MGIVIVLVFFFRVCCCICGVGHVSVPPLTTISSMYCAQDPAHRTPHPSNHARCLECLERLNSELEAPPCCRHSWNKLALGTLWLAEAKASVTAFGTGVLLFPSDLWKAAHAARPSRLERHEASSDSAAATCPASSPCS